MTQEEKDKRTDIIYNLIESAMRDIYVGNEKLKTVALSFEKGQRYNINTFFINQLDKVIDRFRQLIPTQYDQMINEKVQNLDAGLQHEEISHNFNKMNQEQRDKLENYSKTLLEYQ